MRFAGREQEYACKRREKVGTIQSQSFAIPDRNRNPNPNRRLLSAFPISIVAIIPSLRALRTLRFDGMYGFGLID
jgi:hypothetical protein